MGFFEDVVSGAKYIADNAKKAVGGVVDISKLKISLSEVSDKIKVEYQSLGKLVYLASEEGSDYTQEAKAKIEEINALKECKEEIAKKIAKLQGKAVCTQCGTDNAADADFCMRCGARLEREIEIDPEQCDCCDCEGADCCSNSESCDTNCNTEEKKENDNESEKEPEKTN